MIICLIPAVREDRTPGGKHRHKRQRIDGQTVKILTGGASARPSPGHSSSSRNLTIMLQEEDYDEKLLASLVEAQPDLIPTQEGKK